MSHKPLLFSIAAILVSFLVGSLSLFSREPIFYDELINTLKASIWHVWDYALRPVFYLANATGGEYFGGGHRALLLFQLCLFTICSCMVASCVTTLTGLPAGAFALVVLLLSGNFWTLSLTAMPHLLAAIFTLAACIMALCVAYIWVHGQGKARRLLLLCTCTLIFGLLTHPLNLGTFLLCFTILFLSAFLCVSERTFGGASFRRVGYLLFCLAISVICLELIFLAFLNHSYIELWQTGLQKVQQPDLVKKYGKDTTYYWREAIQWLGLALLPAVIVLPRLCVQAIHGRKFLKKLSREEFFFLGFGILVFGSLCFISMAQWKFERVLVQIFPLAVVWVSLGAGIILKKTNTKFHIVSVVILGVILSAQLFLNFFAQVKALHAQAQTSELSRVSNILEALPDTHILYLGLRSGLWRGKVQIGSAGKEMKVLSFYDTKKLRSNPCEMLHYFRRRSISTVLMHRTLPEAEQEKFRLLAHLGYAQLLHADGVEYRIWRIVNWNAKNSLYESILALPSGARVGIQGVKQQHPIFKVIRELGLRSVPVKHVTSVTTPLSALLVAQEKRDRTTNASTANTTQTEGPIFCSKRHFDLVTYPVNVKH